MRHVIVQYTCLLTAILFVVMLAEKIKVAYPILLVLSGLVLGFVPALSGMEIEPGLRSRKYRLAQYFFVSIIFR